MERVVSQSKTYLMADPAAIAAKVKAAGGPQLDPTQPTGEASAEGVTIGWSIANNVITITVIDKPWIVSYGTIWSHVDSLFATS
jgi:hypothetical protein